MRVDIGTGAFHTEGTVRVTKVASFVCSKNRKEVSAAEQRKKGRVEKEMLESQQGTRSRGHHCILF